MSEDKKDESYEVSEEVAIVAKTVLTKDKVLLAADYDKLNVIYMKKYPSVAKTIAAQCIKTATLLKYFSEADVIIQVSGDLWDGLTEESKYVLMLHEMMHIGISYKKNGKMMVDILPHDIQDFAVIIRKYGLDWVESVKTTAASINDFQNGEESTLRI